MRFKEDRKTDSKPSHGHGTKGKKSSPKRKEQHHADQQHTETSPQGYAHELDDPPTRVTDELAVPSAEALQQAIDTPVDTSSAEDTSGSDSNGNGSSAMEQGGLQDTLTVPRIASSSAPGGAVTGSVALPMQPATPESLPTANLPTVDEPAPASEPAPSDQPVFIPSTKTSREYALHYIRTCVYRLHVARSHAHQPCDKQHRNRHACVGRASV